TSLPRGVVPKADPAPTSYRPRSSTATPPRNAPPRPTGPRCLLGVARSHLVFMCGKRSQYLPFLAPRHVEMVERSAKFSRDFIENLGRDLQRAVRFLQAERRASRLRGCIVLRAT